MRAVADRQPGSEIGFRENGDIVRDYCCYPNVARRKILPGHMNQVFENSQSHALGHIHHVFARGIPSSANAKCTFSVQRCVHAPANAMRFERHQEKMLCSMRVRVC